MGLVQVLSVFIDTILICSATAFMCMCSGVEPSEGLSGAPYVQTALSATLGSFGPIFITIAMIREIQRGVIQKVIFGLKADLMMSSNARVIESDHLR